MDFKIPQMDNKNICAEYIVGFCPFDEFSSGEVTAKCSKIHDSSLKNAYFQNSNKVDKEVLEDAKITLETIVRDTDIKIKKHLEMILPKMDKTLQNTLEKLEEIIESKNIDNFTDVLPLLRIHGQLCDMAISEKDLKSEISVCENCAAFKKTEKCIHGFCKKYEKARKVYLELKEKI